MDAFAVERNFYKYEEQIKDVFYFYELFILHSLMLRKIFRYAQFRVVKLSVGYRYMNVQPIFSQIDVNKCFIIHYV